MPLQKLQFKPGIVKDLTAYTNKGGWYDINLVRFRNSFPQSIGGWIKNSTASFLGTCRALFSWNTLTGAYYTAVGTSAKYYVQYGGAYYDITPLRETVVLTNPFTTTNGLTTVVVSDVAHGALQGDYVTFSGSSAVGGVPDTNLNKEFEITYLTVDTYQITVATAATSTATGGGSVTAKYQINTGINTEVTGGGWGAGTWSRGTWGSAVEVTVNLSLRLWAQDNFGEQLLFNVRNGGVYVWDPDLSTLPATTVRAVTMASLSTDSTTPTYALQIIVSDRDRHVIAFGANQGGATTIDPMLIRFSNQEDYGVWTSTAENTAGDLRVGTGSQIIKAIETKREILVWTDVAIYSMQFVGPPFTFGIQQVSGEITTAGFNCFAAVEDTVYWMGMGKFYVYTGATQELPCTIKEHIFNDINIGQMEKVFCGINTEFNEITWFYPSADSSENDLYATFNYADQAWTYGIMARTAWMDRGVNDYPIAAGVDGYLYEHEYGFNDGSTTPATPLNAYIESSPFDIGEGDNFAFVRKIIPDITFFDSTNSPRVDMTLKVQNFPGSAYSTTTDSSVQRTATVPIEQFTNQAYVRLRGRQVTFRVESNREDTRWGLGSPRIEIKPDGRR